jgi:CBS domain-containing protein
MVVINYKSPKRKEYKKPNAQILVKDYMSENVITFFNYESIYLVMSTLSNNKISGAPVINKFGKLVGVVSETDIMKHVLESRYFNMPTSKNSVSNFMTKTVDTISANKTIFDAASKFLELNRKRFPVMSGDKIIGIISRSDIITASLKIKGQSWRK